MYVCNVENFNAAAADRPPVHSFEQLIVRYIVSAFVQHKQMRRMADPMSLGRCTLSTNHRRTRWGPEGQMPPKFGQVFFNEQALLGKYF
jgi:hypothetical protein